MRKYGKLLIALLAAAATLVSCIREAKTLEGGAPSTITVNIPADGLAKVAVTQDSNPDSGMKTAFEAGDVITVRNADNETLAAEFTLQSGAGTTQAVFKADPGASGALAGATKFNIYLVSNMPAGFTEQTQASDNNSAHLGFSVGLLGVNTYEDVSFTQAWASANGGGELKASSVLRIRAQLPTAALAAAVQKVTVKSSAPVFDESSELAINITTPGASGKVITAFATLPAGDVVIPAGTELLFQFQVSADVNDKYTAYRKLGSAMTLYSGQVNAFKLNCPNIQSYAGLEDTGAETHPYLIGDRHQLDKMRDELVSGSRVYFKMVDDVDLTGISWVPVCSNADYQIDFNGSGHTLANLTVASTHTTENGSGFFALLHGFMHNVIIDGANVDGGNKNSGIVAGRSGASSFAADLSDVTIRNSTLTSSNNYVGGFIGYVKKSNSMTRCSIIDSQITSTAGNVSPSLVGGLAGWMGPNGGCTITDCAAERVTVSGGCTNTNRSGVGGLIGRIDAGGVVIVRSHSSGTVASVSANNAGGLVGDILSGTNITIQKCYSTAKVQRGYTNAGGLVGRIAKDTGVTIDHCMASGDLSLQGGYGCHGGLVGCILSPSVTMKESIAWNGTISGGTNTTTSSSGAVVGVAHPKCTLTKNYRKPGITFGSNVYWIPSTNWDHPDVSSTKPLFVLDLDDPVESEADSYYSELSLDGNGQPTNDTANGLYAYNYAYHGHRISNGAVVSPDNTNGWTASPSIPDISEPTDTDPESASYTGNIVWSGWSGATKYTVVNGVQYAKFHAQWQGQWREINIVITELNSHNKLGLYQNYKDQGLMFLDEKCEYLTNVVAATNGSMTSQFVRVDDVVKSTARESSEWTSNCALTIDGDVVDIVKVASNFEAATLPNHNVACAGPLLVWKGNKLTASDAWKTADTDAWLTTTHPRTAFGINKEGTKVIQVAVDGRWTSSNTSQRAIGMSTDLLAQLMLELGCYKAMNFDGGGGTQMWVYNQGDVHHIVNHPHNEWPTYGCGSNEYYWINNNEVARRASSCAVYIQSDLK